MSKALRTRLNQALRRSAQARATSARLIEDSRQMRIMAKAMRKHLKNLSERCIAAP